MRYLSLVPLLINLPFWLRMYRLVHPAKPRLSFLMTVARQYRLVKRLAAILLIKRMSGKVEGVLAIACA